MVVFIGIETNPMSLSKIVQKNVESWKDIECMCGTYIDCFEKFISSQISLLEAEQNLQPSIIRH